MYLFVRFSTSYPSQAYKQADEKNLLQHIVMCLFKQCTPTIRIKAWLTLSLLFYTCNVLKSLPFCSDVLCLCYVIYGSKKIKLIYTKYYLTFIVLKPVVNFTRKLGKIRKIGMPSKTISEHHVNPLLFVINLRSSCKLYKRQAFVVGSTLLAEASEAPEASEASEAS
jgi:hypothetical protein